MAEIGGPALDAGVDEALDQVRIAGDQLVAGGDEAGVAVEAGVGEEKDHRVEAGLLLDDERFAAEVALLDGVLIGEKRGGIEGVGADLCVRVAVFAGEKIPPAGAGGGTDHDGLAAELLEAVMAGAGVGDEDGGVALEHAGDGGEGQLFLGDVEAEECVAGDDEVEVAGHHKLGLIYLRPALADGDVQAVLGVEAGRDGLVVAAVFGLGEPIEAKAHPVGGMGGEVRQEQSHCDHEAAHRGFLRHGGMILHGPPGLRHMPWRWGWSE